MVLAVALAFHAAAVVELGFASGGGARCVDDEGCQLNGKCTLGGVCDCAPEWTGPDCSLLNLKPARPSPHAGYDEQGTSSWGGSIIADPAGSLWHMYVSRMAGHCGLNAWQQNSELIHATSTDPVGPYVYNSTVLPHFAHGPSVRKTPDGYMMMHLGCGVPFVPYIKDCTNGSTPRGEGGSGGDGGNKCTQFNVSVMTSPGVSGPWSPSQPVHLSSGTQQPSWYVQAGGRQFSNPAPHVMSDGTLRCAFRADSRTGGEHVSIATAKSPLGPYIDERSVPAVHHAAEDPCVLNKLSMSSRSMCVDSIMMWS